MMKKEMALEISLMIRTEMTLNSSQTTRTEMVFETVVYLPFNHLVWLLAQEYFNVSKTYSVHDVRGLVVDSKTHGN
jgi:hypothetical protein